MMVTYDPIYFFALNLYQLQRLRKNIESLYLGLVMKHIIFFFMVKINCYGRTKI
jgi:hypothetical protein